MRPSRAALAAAIRRRQRIRRLTGLPSRIDTGRYTYFDGRPTVTSFSGDTGLVHIGAFCSIARNVEFVVGGQHRVDWATTFPLRVYFGLPGLLRDGHPAPRPDIEIGNDVWIGTGACILSGAAVGDGAVVGARSVVTKAVRPYAVVAGNPAREIRRRFDDDTVDRLLALAWWTWPLDRILASVDLLCSPNVERLLDENGRRADRAR